MTNANEFIDGFLLHSSHYDPVKAREYYLRTRKLKGRKAGSTKAANPQSKVGYNGKPLKPLGSRIEEDETPNKSPSGAKLVDYDGKGLGKATYADGSVYDATVGWKQGNVGSAKNNAQRKYNANIANIDKTDKANAPRKRRIDAAEQKVIRAKTLAKRVKDPQDRAELLNRISATERKLRAIKPTSSKPVASTRPVLRRTPPSGV